MFEFLLYFPILNLDVHYKFGAGRSVNFFFSVRSYLSL